MKYATRGLPARPEDTWAPLGGLLGVHEQSEKEIARNEPVKSFLLMEDYPRGRMWRKAQKRFTISSLPILVLAFVGTVEDHSHDLKRGFKSFGAAMKAVEARGKTTWTTYSTLSMIRTVDAARYSFTIMSGNGGAVLHIVATKGRTPKSVLAAHEHTTRMFPDIPRAMRYAETAPPALIVKLCGCKDEKIR